MNQLHKIRPLMNLSEVARRLGVTEQYVGQLFSGVRNSEKRLRQIRKMLKREFREIVELSE